MMYAVWVISYIELLRAWVSYPIMWYADMENLQNFGYTDEDLARYISILKYQIFKNYTYARCTKCDYNRKTNLLLTF